MQHARVLKLELRPLSAERPDRQTLGQVVSQAELLSRRGGWKHAGQGVVCAAGCFDLLHPGHVRLLEQARGLGDLLVVVLESDEAARRRFSQPKVPDRNTPPRPVTPAAERAEIVAALAAVDYVTIVEDGSPREFLARFSPDIFVMASPSELSDLERLGCKIVRVAPEPGYSTSLLIERIREARP